MTIDAEILPVGAVGRIIAGIAVFVMNSQEMSGFEIEFPPAFRTEQPVDSQGVFPVCGSVGTPLFQFPDYFLNAFVF